MLSVGFELLYDALTEAVLGKFAVRGRWLTILGMHIISNEELPMAQSGVRKIQQEKEMVDLHEFLATDCEAVVVEELLLQLGLTIGVCHVFFLLPVRFLLFTWFQLTDAE